MAEEITVTLEGITPFQQKLANLKTKLVKRLINEVNYVAIQLQTHIRQDLFRTYSASGTSHDVLQRRTGSLSKSIQPIPAAVDGDVVRGGISIGTAYAKVHFGKVGQVTTITPKNSKYLTIPLPAAMTAQGVAKGRSGDKAVFGKTFVGKSRAGNLIIFGTQMYQKGKKAGQSKGEVTPLFLLKQSVNVKSRVHPEDLTKWVQPILGKSLEALKAEMDGV